MGLGTKRVAFCYAVGRSFATLARIRGEGSPALGRAIGGAVRNILLGQSEPLTQEKRLVQLSGNGHAFKHLALDGQTLPPREEAVATRPVPHQCAIASP